MASSSFRTVPAPSVWPGNTNTSTTNEREIMRQQIIHYLRAGYAGLYLVSPEEQRVEAELKAIAKEIDFHLYCWSATIGIVDTDTKRTQEATDPLDALLATQNLPEKS